MSTNRSRVVAEILAGSGIGGIIGLVIGLSASPVVSTILGSISVTLLGLLSFRDREKASDPSSDMATGGGTWRIAGFGFACVFTILGGLLIRTHDLLSPRVDVQVKNWESAGFEATDARKVLLYTRLGVVPKEWLIEEKRQLASVGASVLFAGPSVGDCQDLAENQFKNMTEWLRAFRLKGNAFKQLADSVEALPSEKQMPVLRAVMNIACRQK